MNALHHLNNVKDTLCFKERAEQPVLWYRLERSLKMRSHPFFLFFPYYPLFSCNFNYTRLQREQERGRFATNQTNWPLCACEVQLCVVRPGTLQAFVWLLWLLWALPLGKRRVMGLGVFSDYIGALLGYLFIYSRGSGGTENNFPLVFRRLSHIIV